MKAYGLSRLESSDDDALGSAGNGRATRVYSITQRSYKSLRNGKKASARRSHKRRARAEGKALIAETMGL